MMLLKKFNKFSAKVQKPHCRPQNKKKEAKPITSTIFKKKQENAHN